MGSTWLALRIWQQINNILDAPQLKPDPPVRFMYPFVLTFRLALFVFSLIAVTACIPPNRKASAPRPAPASTPSQPPLNSGSSAAPSRETELNVDIPTSPSNEAVLIPKELAAKVVGVHDGDTITVIDRTRRQYKIRLSGIDAPELGQDFGRQAKKQLSDLVFGKDVVITHDKVDRWGRVVGKVMVGDQDVNLSMVAAGVAWHFKRYENEQPRSDRASYANAELNAKETRKGLWVQANPIPPWDFRGR